MESFVAIDYETANSDKRSACSLGVSIVANGKVIETFESLIKPPKEYGEFDPFNTMIHGITKKAVASAPNFLEVWDQIEKYNPNYELPFACHYSGFDIRVTQNLMRHFDKKIQDLKFYDTLTIAKKMWPQLLNHKLNTLSAKFAIELEHHKASSDAEACAKIAIKQMQELNKTSLSEVAENYGYKLGILNSDGVKTMSDFKNYVSNGKHYDNDPKASSSKDVQPSKNLNYGSDFFGEHIVFTGELQSMSRKDAIQLAVNNGASVTSSVTKKTKFLVIGISDFLDFEKGKKTRKLTDAEILNQKGQAISFLDEEDFLRMCAE
jgi:DNA polymerase-3 subunit epsilon